MSGMRIITLHSDSPSSYIEVGLSELPDTLRLVMDDSTRKALFNAAANQSGSLPKLVNLFNVNWATIWRWYHGRRALTISTLKQLCKLSGTRLEDLHPYVRAIKGDTYCRSELYIKLPFMVDERWAYLAELLRTDGHITSDLKMVEIANNDAGVLSWLKIFLVSIGVDPASIHQKPWNKGSYLRICNRTLAVWLHKVLEIPAGNKCGIIYIPERIKRSPNGVIAATLRGAFDGDGWACVRSKRVGITLKSERYVSDIAELLGRLGIGSYIRGPSKNDRYLCEVTRRENLTKFSSIVGFNNSKRRFALERLLASYR